MLGVPASWFDHPGRAYPALVAAARGAALVDLSASAGTLGRVVDAEGRPAPALRAALAREPAVVTVSAGVNDVLAGLAARGGAARALRLAGLVWRTPLGPALLPRLVAPDDLRRQVDRLRGRLGLLLRAVAAPGRCVVVTTYPVGDGDPRTERALLGPVNGAIRAAARETGARVADLEAAFRGHDRRAPRRDRWISWIDGMHPTARGHRAAASVVLAALAAPPGRVSPAAGPTRR